MDNRPKLEENMNSGVFLNHYYLKDELVRFCKQNGLQGAGSKEDITRRIAHYLDDAIACWKYKGACDDDDAFCFCSI